MTDKEQEREYRTVSYLVSTLANICCCAPNQIIDRLTGYAWDAEEAERIKVANMPNDSFSRAPSGASAGSASCTNDGD